MLTLCGAERALNVFCLEPERRILHNYIEAHYLSATIYVKHLRPVWNHIPRGTYWTERVLDCVEDGIKIIYEREARRQRCYCKSRDPNYLSHVNCLANWILTEASLQAALGKYRNSRQPNLYTRFQIDHEHRPSSTAEWVLAIETGEKELSFGKAPREMAVCNKKVTVKQDLCSAIETYQLEWIDESGGYYLESQGCGQRERPKPDRITTTSVSQQWLASRGHRGGAPGSAEGSLMLTYWRPEVLAYAGVSPSQNSHQCPDWLSHDNHMVCAFREGLLHMPKPQRPHLNRTILNSNPDLLSPYGLCRCQGFLDQCTDEGHQ